MAAIGSTCPMCRIPSRSIPATRASLDQRPLPVDTASRRAAPNPRPLRDPVLLRTALRSDDRMPANLHRPDNPPRWEPITYADWQTWWYDAHYNPKDQRDVA